ncbi:MAG: PAS domain S-box protein [Spartobacteria bacterium]|nr:PAS domain S-box protein [Spartobacteria bacterium]
MIKQFFREKNPVMVYMTLLISVNIAGIIALALVNNTFGFLAQRTIQAEGNQLARIGIEREITRQLNEAEVLFYQLAAAPSKNACEFIRSEIMHRTMQISSALQVFEQGGVYEGTVYLNMAHQEYMTVSFSYQPDAGMATSIEILEIKPKMRYLDNMCLQLIALVNQRNLSDDNPEKYNEIQRHITTFVNITDPVFVRLKEYSNKLYFESKERLAQLEKDGQRRRNTYQKVETSLFIIILLAEIAVCAIIGRHIREVIQIQRTDKDAIRANEEKLRHILDTVQTGVILIEADTHNVVDINSAALHMIHANKEDIIGKKCHNHFCPSEFGNCPITDQGKSIDDSERILLQSDRTELPILKNARQIEIQGKKYLLESFIDISERKKADAIIQKQNAFLNSIINALTHPFYVINVENYEVELANAAASASKTEGTSVKCYHIAHHTDIPCSEKDHDCPLQELLNTRKAIMTEHIHFINGKKHICEVHGYPIFDDQGKITHMIEYSIDITERKQAEEKVRKLSQAVEHCPVSIIITDTEGNIEYVNPKFSQLTGYSSNEIIGKNPRILRGTETPQHVFTELWANLNAGNEWRGTFHNKKKSGEYFWEEARISPVFDEHHAITHYVGIKQDITQIRQQQEQLRKAKELAETATRAKSDFLASMSHEIRTPLNGVIGMTDVLLDTPLNSDQKQYAQIIHTSASSLLLIINDILDFSKIEAGKMVLESIDFLLDDMVSETLAAFQYIASEKKVLLNAVRNPDVPNVVRGDPGRIRQMLNNFLSNAVKFTPEGSIVLTISSETNKDKQKIGLRFTVTDSGIGIPSDRLPSLFQQFTQADNSTSRKYGGSGLGLAICRQLANMMHGQTGASSKPGVGSTFWFTVVLDEPVDPHFTGESPIRAHSTDDASTAGADASGNPTKSSPGRVLIVDDNQTNQFVIQTMLSQWNIASDAVNDGQQAVDAVAKNTYSAVLMDCHMPIMDGFTATKKIRHSGGPQKNVPIIALTADVMQGIKDQCKACGMNDYIAKPVTPENVKKILSQWLSFKKTVQKPASEPHTPPAPLAPDAGIDDEFISLPRFVREEFLNRVMNSEDIAKEIIAQHMQRIPEQLKALVQAGNDRDQPKIHQLAHTFKGSCATIAAQRLAAIAMHIENHTRAGEIDDAALHIPLFLTEYEAFEEELRNQGLL